MSRNILVVNGHPDPRPERFCAALCDAYESGARRRGCATRRLDVGALQLSALAVADAPAPSWDALELAFRLLRAADRLAIFYPLWADGPPAELRQLFDYVARLRTHLRVRDAAKAARLVVTTALPALLYRGKDMPALNGVTAAAPLYIGSVDSISRVQRTRWLDEIRDFGEAA